MSRLPADSIQHVLVDPLVACPQACLHAHRCLIGDLDAHLEQADGELRVGLRGDPQPAGVTHYDAVLVRFPLCK